MKPTKQLLTYALLPYQTRGCLFPITHNHYDTGHTEVVRGAKSAITSSQTHPLVDYYKSLSIKCVVVWEKHGIDKN